MPDYKNYFKQSLKHEPMGNGDMAYRVKGIDNNKDNYVVWDYDLEYKRIDRFIDAQTYLPETYEMVRNHDNKIMQFEKYLYNISRYSFGIGLSLASAYLFYQGYYYVYKPIKKEETEQPLVLKNKWDLYREVLYSMLPDPYGFIGGVAFALPAIVVGIIGYVEMK